MSSYFWAIQLCWFDLQSYNLGHTCWGTLEKYIFFLWKWQKCKLSSNEWLFSWFTVISPPNHFVASWLAVSQLFGSDYLGGEMTGYRFPPLPFLFWLLSRVTAELHTLLLRQKQHWIGGQQLGCLLCSARRWWYGTKLKNRWNKSQEFCPKLQSHTKTSCIVFVLLLTLTVGLTALR